MAATIIDGRAIAEQVRAEVARDVAAWVGAGNPQPGLATVLVGDDPASAVYVSGKRKASAEVGIADFAEPLPRTRRTSEVEARDPASSTPTPRCPGSCCSCRRRRRSTGRR